MNGINQYKSIMTNSFNACDAKIGKMQQITINIFIVITTTLFQKHYSFCALNSSHFFHKKGKRGPCSNGAKAGTGCSSPSHWPLSP